jgi:hypothetical protein
MTSDEVRELMRLACQEAGGPKAWAVAHGISPAYVYDALAGRREMGAKILSALGLTKSIDYHPVTKEMP